MSKEKVDHKKEDKTDEQKKIDELNQKVLDLTSTVQHVQADFENYKKRVERDNADYKKFACKDTVMKLFPIIDSLELAIKNKENKDEFIKGTELIYAQIIQTLEELGIKPIPTIDEPFDPNLHEALLTGESEKKNVVLEELQKGYQMHDRVIRHAKVKIGK